MRFLFLLVFLSFSLFAQDTKMGVTPIHAVQGAGAESPMVGKKVAINGIVTATFIGKDKLNGFFVQEQVPDEDENTSEGIFVYDPALIFKGNVGDVVQVIGEVAELKSKESSLTQLKDVSSIFVLSEKNKLPNPVKVQLPVGNWEKYEGMLVEVAAISGPLYVTEMYQLGRFGQLTLCGSGPGNQNGTDGRLDQFTQFNSPDVEAHKSYLEEANQRKIIIDDGSGVRNPAVIPYGREGRPFSMYHAVRGGDHTKSVEGILDHRFDAYRIQPTKQIYFKAANLRENKVPKLPRKTTLTVAAFNVLNYFNGDGQGGGFPTSRGASSPEELVRQKDKTLSVILGSKADVLALMEIENDGYGEYSAIKSLVNDLNAASGGKRNFIAVEAQNPATDAITSAIIYDANKVAAVGLPVTIPDGYGKASFDTTRRKPVIQTFRQLSNDKEFTLVAVHFKSKGVQSAGPANEDKGDGQARNNQVRMHQAEDLIAWLGTKPTQTEDPDYLLIGDFNAYAMEDPMTYLDAYEYKSLFPAKSYSYVFDGFWGSLDHALATPSLKDQVTGAKKWHINSDEAMLLDYNTENKTVDQVRDYYDKSVFRSSDHDPLIIGLRLRD